MVQGSIRLQIDTAHEARNAANCGVMRAMRDALAILNAIEEGGLLDVLPEHENDRRRHQTGRTMLELLETRLRHAIAVPDGGVSGECRCNGK